MSNQSISENSTKVKIQIKSILGTVLFEYEKEGNTIKETVEKAVATKVNLSWANLSSADLSKANLSGANLSSANLRGAILSEADLSGANLSSADLSVANLSVANLSGAKGILDPIQYLQDKFEFTPDGLIAYKTFGDQYSVPKDWKIEAGSVVSEVVNQCPVNDCGCGINIATLDWVKTNYPGTIWKVLVRNAWLPSVVVPYRTDGKIRAGRVELLEIIPR